MSEVELIYDFNNVVQEFVDSLPLFKKLLQKRKKEKGKSFSISALIGDFLPEKITVSLHNAIDDVKILKVLLHKLVKTETKKIMPN